jgi:hypothetical protein
MYVKRISIYIDGKYRATLPPRDDPDARQGEKESRKEAKKVTSINLKCITYVLNTYL